MKTNDIDRRVGERLRSRRLKMGLSQTELAAAAEVTFQQVQKYERGTNRISAGRIIQFAERLGVAPAYFVEGFGGGSKANGDTIKSARAIESAAASNDGVAVLEAMAQMKPGRRKFMVTQLTHSGAPFHCSMLEVRPTWCGERRRQMCRRRWREQAQ